METAWDLDKLTRDELLEIVNLTSGISQPKEETKFSIFEPTSEPAHKCHLSRARTRALIGGNRACKTTSLCIEGVINSTGKIPPSLEIDYPKDLIKIPSFVRLIGVDYTNGVEKILIPELLKWLPLDEIQSYSKEFRTFYLRCGSKIEFMSYDQDITKFGGTSRQFIGFDEVPPPDVYKENRMRVADCGGRMMFSMTAVHHEKDEKGRVTSNAEAIAFFYDNIYSRARRIVDSETDTINPDGLKTIECFHTDTFSNKHIDLVAMQEIADEMDEKDLECRIKGRFQHLAGRVFPEFEDKLHIVEDFKIPEEWPIYMAIDPHPKQPHHVTFITVDPYNRKYVCGEIKLGPHALISELAKAIKAKWQTSKYWMVRKICDPSASQPDPITGTSIAQELREVGIPTIPGSKDLFTGIYRVKDALRLKELFFFKSCIGHKWEIVRYIWGKDRPLDKDDHYMENLRRILITNPIFINKQEWMNEMGQFMKWKVI